jgi:hypothetical protein
VNLNLSVPQQARYQRAVSGDAAIVRMSRFCEEPRCSFTFNAYLWRGRPSLVSFC